MNKEQNLSEQIMASLQKYIKEKDILNADGQEMDQEKMLKYLLAGVESSRDIQSGLYNNFQKQGSLARKIKNKIITKVGNITRNVVELSFMRQQKFNEGAYALLAFLVKENIELKEEIANLKVTNKHDK